MGRFLLGAGVLAVLLVLGLWVGAQTERTMTPIVALLEQAEEKTLAGDIQAGNALAQQARQRWHAHRACTAAFSDHAPMDEIEGLFAQLDSYTRQPIHHAACCAQLAELVQAMTEAHGLAWWSLL